MGRHWRYWLTLRLGRKAADGATGAMLNNSSGLLASLPATKAERGQLEMSRRRLPLAGVLVLARRAPSRAPVVVVVAVVYVAAAVSVLNRENSQAR
jgi:hypothetical protein